MKLYPSFPIFFVFVAIVLAAPFIPSAALLILDSLVVRVALIAVLLFMTRMGPIPSLFCFMAIAALFLERNRRKVGLAQKALDRLQAMDSTSKPLAEVGAAAAQSSPAGAAGLLQSHANPVAPVEFDRPIPRETGFLPLREMDTATFEPVGESINEKVVLASAYRGGAASVSDRFHEFA